MEKTVTRDQMNTILEGRPKGVSGKEIIDTYIANGYKVEGINWEKPKPTLVDKAKEYATEAVTNPLETAKGVVKGAVGGAAQLTKLVEAPGKFVTSKIAEAVGAQAPQGLDFAPVEEMTQASNKAQEVGKVVGTLLPVERAIGGANLAVKAGKEALDIAKTGTKATSEIAGKIAEAVTPDPASIMQRVARIPKQKQIKFQNAAGESVGEYLTKRGIYGDEEQIVEQLYKRFSESKKVADDALAELPGTYQPQQVKDALEMLSDKFTKSSTKGAKDPNLDSVNNLIKKFDSEGLSMTEINETKRLFERNAKLDFARENNPDGIRLANNVDNAIREWQFTQAEKLGLQNLPDINKEIRLARQLMDDLGAESAGIAGNNAVSLTDWIVLAEGNPASIAAFLGKKAASSKKLQSAIAKKVAKKPTVGTPEAKFTPSKQAK